MNKFLFLFILFICFSTSELVAQHRLTGRVIAANDSTHVAGCTVTLNNGAFITSTDSSGRFHFKDLDNGTYVVNTYGIGFIANEQTVVVNGKNKHINVLLQPEHTDDVIDITSTTSNSHLEDVEDMAIYAGKKSEVIILDSLVVNAATNNARQVYARVPGLNIWENEGAGIQLSIGGRGLDPNRTSNFNVRQNGYDISADALGYPESYYTPPVEGLERIQVIRGAASLQYGTQFGGMLNFIIRKPVPDKRIQLVARQTVGSYGSKPAFSNTFVSLSGTQKKLSYYTYFQYKTGNGWRPNSDFDVYNYYGNVNYQISKRTSIGFDLTLMSYLAHQPGGLSDAMFKADPRQSNRERNWFQVNWRMAAIHFNHKFNDSNEVNVRVFGLLANRYSIGFRPNRVATIDDGTTERDLIKGAFKNIGAEARYMKRYHIRKQYNVLLVGGRVYYGNNVSTQGQGSKGSDADFDYTQTNFMTYDYMFLNHNVSLFAENIFYLGNKVSVTPGLRYEYIYTSADGYYGSIAYDLAGNIINQTRTDEFRSSARQFILGGIGVSYKPIPKMNFYGNISQNYRSITFSDMRISNPSSVIDPDMKDEKGFTTDIGLRSEGTKRFIYDGSFFILNYNNRIGEYLTADASNRVVRERTNIGQAVMMGVECYLEYDVLKAIVPVAKNWTGILFTNSAYIHSQYVASGITAVQGNEVEFVPKFNFKGGARASYKKFKASFQYSYLTEQFSDATNAVDGGVSGVVGIIPSYYIMDMGFSYEYRIFKLEANINNFTNQYYFTRRATGYPGPGILPSDGRAFYLTLQVKI